MVFVSLRTMLFILFAMLILTLVGGQFVAAFFVAAFIAFVIWRMRWGQRKNNEYAETARNRISSENQTGKSERSASTMQHATATQTTKAAAQSVAQLIGETFSSSRFTELFKDESFADGWKLGDALAVWYFLGTVSLVSNFVS
jgi:Ca2+/Na+ antiporter